MSDIFAQHAQLLTALYSAAAVLLEAVTDPVAIEQAPLKHRSTALNAVASLIGQLNKSRPTPVLSPDTRIEWDFGPDEDEDQEPDASDPGLTYAPAPDSEDAEDSPRFTGGTHTRADEITLSTPFFYDRALDLTIRGATQQQLDDIARRRAEVASAHLDAGTPAGKL